MASLCLVASVLVLAVFTVALCDVPFVGSGAEGPLPSPDEMALEAERSRLLDQRIESMHLLRAEREDIVTELEEGNISLDDAMESFRKLNRQEPLGWDVLRRQYPEQSEQELLGYQVLIYAAGRLHRGDDITNPFVRDLIGRLRERFGPQTLIPSHLEL
jgi:hypothetical protein